MQLKDRNIPQASRTELQTLLQRKHLSLIHGARKVVNVARTTQLRRGLRN